MVYGIIAAGEGSRLRADGYTGFKPMVEIAGEALIQRLIRIFQNNQASAIYIILNNTQTAVGDFIMNLPASKSIPIHLLYKDTPSSFHSFYALLQSMDKQHQEQLCISTIDPIFTEAAFKGYIQTFKEKTDIDGLMAVTSYIEDDKPLHVFTDQDDRITKFASQPLENQPWISGGIYLLRRKALEVSIPAMAAGISKMRNYQQALLDAGLYIKAYDLGRIIDIDHLSDIPLAEDLIQSTII